MNSFHRIYIVILFVVFFSFSCHCLWFSFGERDWTFNVWVYIYKANFIEAKCGDMSLLIAHFQNYCLVHLGNIVNLGDLILCVHFLYTFHGKTKAMWDVSFPFNGISQASCLICIFNDTIIQRSEYHIERIVSSSIFLL